MQDRQERWYRACDAGGAIFDPFLGIPW